LKLICPACGKEATKVAAAFSTASAAYCKHCGWNAALSVKKLRLDLQGWWIAAIFGMLFSLFVSFKAGIDDALLVASAFVLFPCVLAWLSHFRIQRVKKFQAQSEASGATPLTPPMNAPQPLVSGLQYGERPRSVKLSWRGWLYSAGVGTLLLVLLVLLKLIFKEEPLSLHSGKDALVLGFFIWYAWLCISFFRNRWRERRLLLEGRFANGIVTEQKEQSRSLPQIYYSFRSLTGVEFRARTTDFSRRLYEGMPISVFYDELDPARSVALEASVFWIG
jgi:hypothetical protein